MQKMSFNITRLSILVVVLTAAIVSACQKEKGPEQQPVNLELHGSIDVPKFKSSLGITKAAPADMARAAKFLNEDQVSVYIVPRRESSTAVRPQIELRATGNYRDNLIYKYDLANSKFLIQGAVSASYPNSKTYIDIYGIFPHLTTNLTSTTAHPISVSTTQAVQANFLASDFMNALCLDKAPGSTAANLVFHHRLSRAIINITVPTTYKGVATRATGAISEVRIIETKTAATVNLLNTADPLVATGSAQNITANISTVISPGNIYTAEAILIPQTANFVIEADLLTTDGAKHTFKYEKTGQVLAPETKFEFAFSMLGENTLTLGASAISAWGTNLELGNIISQKKAATESFSYTAASATYSTTKFVVVKCNDGYEYKVPATYDGTKILFTFSGKYTEAPELYPYSITGLTPQNQSGTNIGAALVVTPAKVVSARTSTVIAIL